MKELYRIMAEDYKREGIGIKQFAIGTAAAVIFLLACGLAELLEPTM